MGTALPLLSRLAHYQTVTEKYNTFIHVSMIVIAICMQQGGVACFGAMQFLTRVSLIARTARMCMGWMSRCSTCKCYAILYSCVCLLSLSPPPVTDKASAVFLLCWCGYIDDGILALAMNISKV